MNTIVRSCAVAAAALLCVAASSAPAGAVAGGERRANTTITEVLCTYATNQAGSALDVTIVVSWRGNDPYGVNTPIQYDTFSSYSAGFFPSRAENRANSATRTLATPISSTVSTLSVQAGAWVDANGTILTWTPATPCSPAP